MDGESGFGSVEAKNRWARCVAFDGGIEGGDEEEGEWRKRKEKTRDGSGRWRGRVGRWLCLALAVETGRQLARGREGW